MPSEALNLWKIGCGVAQEADDGVYSFFVSRSPLYPSIYVLLLGRGLFSSVTFKEDFTLL